PQEGRPALPVAAGPRATHVSLDGSLADADAELEQLAAETLRAPARIAGGHLSDKRRTRGRGSTRRPRASAPERATACLVPAEDGRRLDEQRGVAPRRRQACCEPHREALPRCPPDPPRDLSLRDDELLPKQGVLGDETRRGGARRRRPAPPRTEGPRSCGALYRGQRADGICSQDGPCYALDSPCNERFLVPVGPRRRMGRLIRKFQQSYAMTFILRCRPARKRCKNTATNVTTTTVPGELAVEGIWTFTTTGLEDSCPAATTSPIDTSIRIARYGSHLLGCGPAFHGEEWEGASSNTDFTLALNNLCCDVGCKGGDGTYTTYHVAGTLHGTSTSAGADTLSLT